MPTNIQGWLRDYSERLASSFRSSGRFKHAVTKGESREHQILDTLSKLLPTRAAVESNVIIIDATDVQSPKFDGALVDLAAIEVKSSLNKTELDDVFRKSAKLRAMRSGRSRPLVTAFAYECPNANLSFFDFAVRFYRAPETSPSSVCVLNKHLFALARVVDTKFVLDDEPNTSSIPILYTPREDTLLVYLNFLSQWVTVGTSAAVAFMRYSQGVFSKQSVFYFEDDFLVAVNSSENDLLAARKHFERKANEDIEKLYSAARTAIGLRNHKPASP